MDVLLYPDCVFVVFANSSLARSLWNILEIYRLLRSVAWQIRGLRRGDCKECRLIGCDPAHSVWNVHPFVEAMILAVTPEDRKFKSLLILFLQLTAFSYNALSILIYWNNWNAIAKKFTIILRSNKTELNLHFVLDIIIIIIIKKSMLRQFHKLLQSQFSTQCAI